jgi:hypothetical protein
MRNAECFSATRLPSSSNEFCSRSAGLLLLIFPPWISRQIAPGRSARISASVLLHSTQRNRRPFVVILRCAARPDSRNGYTGRLGIARGRLSHSHIAVPASGSRLIEVKIAPYQCRSNQRPYTGRRIASTADHDPEPMPATMAV